MTDNPSSGLRYHKIGNDGKHTSSQSTIAAAFSAATTVATLVTRFRANTFRYLLLRWIVTMHIALKCLKN